MAFDLDETIADGLDEVKGILKDDWGDIRNEVIKIFDAKKTRLGVLAENRLQNKYTEEVFQTLVENEKIITSIELKTIAVMKKATAEKIANAFIKVFNNAVKLAIEAAL